MSSLRAPTLRDRLSGTVHQSARLLLKEVAAFGLIGALAFAIDIGLFTWLTHALHVGALKSKAVSTLVSTTFAYFGNRHLSFSHRARSSIRRETSFFFGINLITLVFAEVALALTVYGFGYGHSSGVVSVVNLATIAVGTVFRFWAYKRFVFLHPDRVSNPARTDAELAVELAE